MPRWLVGLTGLLVLVFGLLCLNYTKASGLEHHQEVAAQHGLLPPTDGILHMGVLAVVLGAGAVGFTIGRRKARP